MFMYRLQASPATLQASIFAIRFNLSIKSRDNKSIFLQKGINFPHVVGNLSNVLGIIAGKLRCKLYDKCAKFKSHCSSKSQNPPPSVVKFVAVIYFNHSEIQIFPKKPSAIKVEGERWVGVL